MMRDALVLCVLASALCAACGDHSVAGGPASGSTGSKTAEPAPPPAALVTVTPEQRTQATVLETSGKVQFNEEALARVHAPVTGRVLEVLAGPGDVVEPGSKLLVIDSPDLGAAKSDYAKAVADAERAAAALKLARELLEVKAVARKEIREAESEASKSAAERERAAARLKTLGVRDERLADIAARVDTGTALVVTAPRSGVIVERNVSPGQVVAYGQSDTPVNLFAIADLSTMWVLADVYEPDVPRIHLGQAVTVTPPCCPGERYEGRIAYIADVVDKETRTLKVRAVVPNRGRSLKAEMFVKVAIDTGVRRALTLPLGAIHREGKSAFVLVQRGPGDYEKRSVTVGAEQGGFAEITDGVTPADRVVSAGGILVKRDAK
jgi:membrane fusion protein, heavy metal efflux system